MMAMVIIIQLMVNVNSCHLFKPIISVLWLGSDSVFSLPSFSKLDDCLLPLPPKKLHKTMLSLRDGQLQQCGGKTRGQVASPICFTYERGGKWSESEELEVARYSSSITQLRDGSLWIAGGIASIDGATETVKSSEVFSKKGKFMSNFCMVLLHKLQAGN